MRQDGSHEHPYSALNLRLLLAVFGLFSTGVLALLSFRAGYSTFGWIFAVFAVIAAVDIVVVQVRRHRRDKGHSLFE